MTANELVPSARKWLRIVSTNYDAELEQTIEACISDLSNAGVRDFALDLNDSLVQQAVKLYLKAEFGNNDKAERYAANYEHLKNAIAIASQGGVCDA